MFSLNDRREWKSGITTKSERAHVIERVLGFYDGGCKRVEMNWSLYDCIEKREDKKRRRGHEDPYRSGVSFASCCAEEPWWTTRCGSALHPIIFWRGLRLCRFVEFLVL